MKLPLQTLSPKQPRLRVTRGQNVSFHYHVDCLMTPFAANHSYEYNSMPHALKPKIDYLYRNRDPNTLWWRVMTQHLPVGKVVRTVTAKKLRRLFCEVLNENGLDAEGRPLKREQLPQEGRFRLRPARGTIDIWVQQSAITQRKSQVKAEMNSLLARTLKGIDDMASNRDSKKQRTSPSATVN